MTQQQRDLLHVIATQTDQLIRDLQTTTTEIGSSNNTVHQTSTPLREVIDALDRTYETNRAMTVALDGAFTRALTITAALVGLLRENGGAA